MTPHWRRQCFRAVPPMRFRRRTAGHCLNGLGGVWKKMATFERPIWKGKNLNMSWSRGQIVKQCHKPSPKSPYIGCTNHSQSWMVYDCFTHSNPVELGARSPFSELHNCFSMSLLYASAAVQGSLFFFPIGSISIGLRVGSLRVSQAFWEVWQFFDGA